MKYEIITNSSEEFVVLKNDTILLISKYLSRVLDVIEADIKGEPLIPPPNTP